MSDACATCTGMCCYDVLVRITGYDAWRIKRAQALEFAQFLSVGPDEPAGPGAFLVGGERRAIYLGKNAENQRACAFLMHLPGDVRRCGVYAERPRVCAVYPMTFKNGSVALRADVRCEASNWNMATITYPYWRRSLLEHLFESHLYGIVAQSWNETSAKDGATLADYYAHVQRCFDAIDARRSEIGTERFDELTLNWQQSDADEDAQKRIADFLAEVRAICAQ